LVLEEQEYKRFSPSLVLEEEEYNRFFTIADPGGARVKQMSIYQFHFYFIKRSVSFFILGMYLLMKVMTVFYGVYYSLIECILAYHEINLRLAGVQISEFDCEYTSRF
jgi:hypothetical protein